MIRIKKFVRAFLITGTAAMLMIMPAMAGNTGYAVTYFKNTGQTYNVYTAAGNTKAATSRSWVVSPTTVSYTDTSTASWGITHALFTYANRGGIGPSSTPIWLKSATRATAGWNSGEGKANVTYYIGVRLDDVLDGYGYSKGQYNSDSY